MARVHLDIDKLGVTGFCFLWDNAIWHEHMGGRLFCHTSFVDVNANVGGCALLSLTPSPAAKGAISRFWSRVSAFRRELFSANIGGSRACASLLISHALF